jgi:chaperone required for assembly of F1-ATPase
MMIEIVIKRIDKKFFFYKGNDQVFLNASTPFYVFTKKHANLVLKEMIKKPNKNQFSVLNLTRFSAALTFEDRKKIIALIIDVLRNDLVLFRCFDDNDLLKLLSKKLDKYIKLFSKEFKLRLSLTNSLSIKRKQLNYEKFNDFLTNLDNFELSSIYKLSSFTKSVILSYFFIEKKISYKKLFDLTNLENKFQQKLWGYVDEQKKLDSHSLEILKNISIFFKNIN